MLFLIKFQIVNFLIQSKIVILPNSFGQLYSTSARASFIVGQFGFLHELSKIRNGSRTFLVKPSSSNESHWFSSLAHLIQCWVHRVHSLCIL